MNAANKPIAAATTIPSARRVSQDRSAVIT